MAELGGSPTLENQRIESLDVLRGFALLGILLLNIIGFGFVASAYTVPELTIQSTGDLIAWAVIDMTAEGAMRGMFSILFGAGVVLFLGRGEGRTWLHYKRTFWLLIFGLLNGYVLLWTGDILVTYALAGFVLYFVRGVDGRKMLITAGILIGLLTLYNAAMYFGLSELRNAAAYAAELKEEGQTIPEGLSEAALGWEDFRSELHPTAEVAAKEIGERASSYSSAFTWTLDHNTDILLGTVWYILLPDALVVMLLGMALYKLGVLQGQLAEVVYKRMAIFGFAVGLTVNAYEIWGAYNSHFDLLGAFSQIQPTYHIGRIAMAMGWIGLVILLHRRLNFGSRLASVGRMALTNYLMHSTICLFIFTGAGFGLVEQMARWQLYFVVIAIWVWQLWFSPWWLERFYFGPVEWLWRALTYGRMPDFVRQN